jgi:hypothetical protein
MCTAGGDEADGSGMSGGREGKRGKWASGRRREDVVVHSPGQVLIRLQDAQRGSSTYMQRLQQTEDRRRRSGPNAELRRKCTDHASLKEAQSASKRRVRLGPASSDATSTLPFPDATMTVRPNRGRDASGCSFSAVSPSQALSPRVPCAPPDIHIHHAAPPRATRIRPAHAPRSRARAGHEYRRRPTNPLLQRRFCGQSSLYLTPAYVRNDFPSLVKSPSATECRAHPSLASWPRVSITQRETYGDIPDRRFNQHRPWPFRLTNRTPCRPRAGTRPPRTSSTSPRLSPSSSLTPVNAPSHA